MAWLVYEGWVTHPGPKTCDRCLALHGRVFPRGEGPQPPLHDDCNCERREVYRVEVPDGSAPDGGQNDAA